MGVYHTKESLDRVIWYNFKCLQPGAASTTYIKAKINKYYDIVSDANNYTHRSINNAKISKYSEYCGFRHTSKTLLYPFLILL